MDSIEFTGFLCGIIFLTFAFLGLSIPALIIGSSNSDDPCMHGKRGGVNLSDWLILYGIEKIVTYVLFMLSSLLIFIDEFLLIVPSIILYLDTIFQFTITIFGIVLLSTNENNNCVSSGSDLAIMTIIIITIGTCISCVNSCSVMKK